MIYSGIKLFFQNEAEIHPEKNPVLRLFRRWVPVTKDYEDNKFFVRNPGLYATPLFVVLLVVETTDLLFAVDSIPAILAITRDAFIVYTSNVFAILGLRSMYFALAGMMEMFRYLHYGLSLVLVFVGAKMLAVPLFRDPDSSRPGRRRRRPGHLSSRVHGQSQKEGADNVGASAHARAAVADTRVPSKPNSLCRRTI